jgi:hypothetical protein
MDLQEMGFEYVDWIHGTQDRVQILVLLNKVIKLAQLDKDEHKGTLGKYNHKHTSIIQNSRTTKRKVMKRKNIKNETQVIKGITSD